MAINISIFQYIMAALVVTHVHRMDHNDTYKYQVGFQL